MRYLLILLLLSCAGPEVRYSITYKVTVDNYRSKKWTIVNLRNKLKTICRVNGYAEYTLLEYKIKYLRNIQRYRASAKALCLNKIVK